MSSVAHEGCQSFASAVPARNPGRTNGSSATTVTSDGAAAPPLQWWRHLPAEAFTGMRLQRLRRAMAGIGMVGEPRWPDAVRGYPAAAVAVALKTLAQPDLPDPILDLTASTLLIPAIAGDTAAIRLLVDMIRRHREVADAIVERSWRKRLEGSRTRRPTPRKSAER